MPILLFLAKTKKSSDTSTKNHADKFSDPDTFFDLSDFNLNEFCRERRFNKQFYVQKNSTNAGKMNREGIWGRKKGSY